MKKSDLSANVIQETEVTVIGEGVHLNGILEFVGVVRVYGKLSGEIKAGPNSSVILMESAVIEGSLDVESVVIAGFVRGKVRATTRVSIEGTGRVIGNIETPSIKIDFGAYLEGETEMTGKSKSP
ncbi:MAG: polymer-forming cytoskeletal protein [Cryobacterium sp.]|nr:polymer-forming cytoskeletal protein [Oligoflexia bacterium]